MWLQQSSKELGMSEEISLNVETLLPFVTVAHPFVLYPIELGSTLALPTEQTVE